MSTHDQWEARKPAHLQALGALTFVPLDTVTRQLQAEDPRGWRSRYHQSDASGAIRAAARRARETAAPVMVFASNRFGAFCWAVELPGSPTMDGSLSLARGGRSKTYRVHPDGRCDLVKWGA